MSTHIESNKRIAKNTVFLTIRMIVVMLLSFFTTRVVLRTLGVIDYGIYNVVGGFVSLFGFINTSMSNGIQRFLNYELGKNGSSGAKTVFSTAILIQLMSALILALLVEVIGVWYIHYKMVIPLERMEAAEWVFQTSVLSFVVVILTSPFSGCVMAHEKMNLYAIVNVIDAVLKLLIAIAIGYSPVDRLKLYGVLFALISILNLTIYCIYCRRNFDEAKCSLKFDKSMFKLMLSFSGWNIFGSFAGVMKEQGLNMVLNLFFGPIVNAARGVATQVNGALQSFVRNISIPVRPQVVQAYATGDLKRSMNLTYAISKISSYIVILLAVPIVININYILSLWLDSNVPEHTSSFISIIFAISLVSDLNAAVSGIVHATGRIKKYQILTSLIEISAIPISYFVLPRYSVPELSMLIVLATIVISQIVSLYILRELVPFSIAKYMKEVVLPVFFMIAITIVSVKLVHECIGNQLLNLVLDTLCSIIVTTICLYFLCFNKSERVLFVGMIRKLIKKI